MLIFSKHCNEIASFSTIIMLRGGIESQADLTKVTVSFFPSFFLSFFLSYFLLFLSNIESFFIFLQPYFATSAQVPPGATRRPLPLRYATARGA